MYVCVDHRKMMRGAETISLLLLAIAMLVACAENDEVVMPTEPAMVKTELTFAFANVKAATHQTRMAEDIVQGQQTPVFRGIQDIRLFAHVNDPDNLDESKRDYWKLVDLTNAYPNDDVVTQFYKDVEVPLNTDKFRFYGEARRETDYDPAVNGKMVTPTFDADDFAHMSFGLSSIVTDLDTPDSKASALADYLTSIASALASGDQYDRLLTNTAGSSANVFALVKQLYANITNPSDALKNAIQGVGKNTNDLTDKYYANIDNNDVITFTDVLAGYPAGLPDGAARMSWNGTAFVANAENSSIIFDGATLSSYVYPPALYYFVETPVRTSSSIHMYGYADWLNARHLGYAVNGVQDYDASWEHFLDMYEYNKTTDQNNPVKVDIYSHSVALADSIDYAVSRLDVTIKAETSALLDAAGRQVHFSSSAFPITGILIGNQSHVNSQFYHEHKTGNFLIIYDTAMPSGMILTTNQTPVNSTLVLESCYEAGNDGNGKKVKVAVEFLNNSGFDFYGKKGSGASENDPYPLIPNGTKFYLIGELDPAGASNPTVQDRVFKKGAVTSVDFEVSSFANAYNVVPDLRNPRLELGMSANLHWQTGIVIPKTQI